MERRYIIECSTDASFPAPESKSASKCLQHSISIVVDPVESSIMGPQIRNQPKSLEDPKIDDADDTECLSSSLARKVVHVDEADKILLHRNELDKPQGDIKMRDTDTGELGCSVGTRSTSIESENSALPSYSSGKEPSWRPAAQLRSRRLNSVAYLSTRPDGKPKIPLRSDTMQVDKLKDQPVDDPSLVFEANRFSLLDRSGSERAGQVAARRASMGWFYGSGDKIKVQRGGRESKLVSLGATQDSYKRELGREDWDWHRYRDRDSAHSAASRETQSGSSQVTDSITRGIESLAFQATTSRISAHRSSEAEIGSLSRQSRTRIQPSLDCARRQSVNPASLNTLPRPKSAVPPSPTTSSNKNELDEELRGERLFNEQLRRSPIDRLVGGFNFSHNSLTHQHRQSLDLSAFRRDQANSLYSLRKACKHDQPTRRLSELSDENSWNESDFRSKSATNKQETELKARKRRVSFGNIDDKSDLSLVSIGRTSRLASIAVLPSISAADISSEDNSILNLGSQGQQRHASRASIKTQEPSFGGQKIKDTEDLHLSTLTNPLRASSLQAQTRESILMNSTLQRAPTNQQATSQREKMATSGPQSNATATIVNDKASNVTKQTCIGHIQQATGSSINQSDSEDRNDRQQIRRATSETTSAPAATSSTCGQTGPKRDDNSRVESIMANAKLRQEEFARLLEEHEQIVNEINRVETKMSTSQSSVQHDNKN